jgi:hypothetical protein
VRSWAERRVVGVVIAQHPALAGAGVLAELASRLVLPQLQLPKVPAASVIRALLAQLEQDPALAERVLPDVLRDAEENRRRK